MPTKGEFSLPNHKIGQAMVSDSSAFGSQTVILIFHLFVIFTNPEIVPFAPKHQYFLSQMESHLQIPKKKIIPVSQSRILY